MILPERPVLTFLHVRAVPSSSNRSDGFGIDAQAALCLHRREILKACSLPEVYQYSSFKKDAKSCVIRQPSAISFQLRLT